MNDSESQDNLKMHIDYSLSVRMSSSPAISCPLFLSQLRLSPTLFSLYDLYDNTIFILMTSWPGLPPSPHHYNSMPCLPHFPLGGPLWEVPSGRWEVVFYSVWFALLTLCLWPWRHSQKNKTSFEDISILLLAGLAVTQTITLCLWLTTLTSAYLALPDSIHWGQRGCYPAGKLRVFWEFLNNLLTPYPAGKLWVIYQFAHHFDLN